MLKIFSLLGLTIIVFLWVDQAPSISYHIEDFPDIIAEDSLSRWKIQPIKAKNKFAADLVIKRINLYGLWGVQKGRTIYIDTDTNFTSEQLKNLVAHEIGHYLLLSHNQLPDSIMNDQIPLLKRSITEKDLSDVSYIKLRLAWCKIASKIDLISQAVDFN